MILKKKLISRREGNIEVEIWIGALQGPMVVSSIIRSLDRKAKLYDQPPDLFSVAYLEYLLQLCEQADIIFIVIAQLCNDCRTGLVDMVSTCPSMRTPSAALPSNRRRRPYTSTDSSVIPCDVNFNGYKDVLFIVISGVGATLLAPEHRMLCNADITRVIEDVDTCNDSEFLHHINFDRITYSGEHQHQDIENSSATFTTYVPLYANSESVIWIMQQANGVVRTPLESEVHGYGSRSGIAGKVELTQASTSVNRSGLLRTDGEFTRRARKYTVTLTSRDGAILVMRSKSLEAPGWKSQPCKTKLSTG